MKKTELDIQIEQSMEDLSRGLLELRDALNILSLALKDWQFNFDNEKRDTANKEMSQLLQRVTSNQGRDW